MVRPLFFRIVIDVIFNESLLIYIKINRRREGVAGVMELLIRPGKIMGKTRGGVQKRRQLR